MFNGICTISTPTISANRHSFHLATQNYLNMQFPTLTLLASIMAVAASAQECSYEYANYLSVCNQGDNLFCSGNINACPKGKTDTFDETATKENEKACVGLSAGDSCQQTIACC